VKTAPVVAGTLSPSADGRNFAAGNADRHGRHDPQDGGLRRAEQLFLRGNDLPARWRGSERFVVLDTGFGIGANFLATWNAWRDDPQRSERLHFIAVDPHPLTAVDLTRAQGQSAPVSYTHLTLPTTYC
jgi:tRNA 5-methylaminomethyl-2-thiouridine biosynthesis bifunctional protein